jgi:hypothetical protein
MKPTKVTLDDIELANEISVVTTIKSLLDEFRAVLDEHFNALLDQAESSNNPVALYNSIRFSGDALGESAQNLQAKLLETLGQMDDEDAHAVADPEAEISVNVFKSEEIDETLTSKEDEIDISSLISKEEKEKD